MIWHETGHWWKVPHQMRKSHTMKTELMWGVFLGKVRGWESEGRDGWERGGWEGLPASSEE